MLRASAARTTGLFSGLVFGGALAVLSTSACTQPAGTAPAFPKLDFDYYVCVIDPILEQGCSYVACHGQQTHALRVYSLGKLRGADGISAWDRSHKLLSRDELDGNYNSAQAFFTGVATAADSLLLREPLPVSQGGPAHYGGPIWSGTSDGRYQAILQWAKGAKITSLTAAQQKSCNALLGAVGAGP